jgi:hypothetical protein
MQTPVFYRVSGTLDVVYSFLDTLNCPTFLYADVLFCYSRLVGREWCREAPPPFVLTPDLPQVDSVSEHSSDEVSPPVGRPWKVIQLRWSPQEDEAVIRGLARYGWGHWKEIIASEPLLAKNRGNRALAAHAIWLDKTRRYGPLRRKNSI